MHSETLHTLNQCMWDNAYIVSKHIEVLLTLNRRIVRLCVHWRNAQRDPAYTESAHIKTLLTINKRKVRLLTLIWRIVRLCFHRINAYWDSAYTLNKRKVKLLSLNWRIVRLYTLNRHITLHSLYRRILNYSYLLKGRPCNPLSFS